MSSSESGLAFENLREAADSLRDAQARLGRIKGDGDLDSETRDIAEKQQEIARGLENTLRELAVNLEVAEEVDDERDE